MDSLKVGDDAAAAVAVAPRVSLADIETAIGGVYYTRGHFALDLADQAVSPEHVGPLAKVGTLGAGDSTVGI